MTPDEPVLDAMELCNGCEIERADPASPAGYCPSCERDARLATKGTPE